MKPTDMLTPHFRLAEFLHGGSMEGVTLDIIENLRLLSQKLEGIREIFGKPIVINSGFRTPEHNRAVGGVKNSYHTKGMAADIIVPGMAPSEVQKHLEDWAGGMGCYQHFTHLDIRGYKSRWVQK